MVFDQCSFKSVISGVACCSKKKVMSLTVTLSRRLQSPKLDLSDGAEMVAGKRLQKWRLDDRTWLGGEYSVFAQAEIFADIAGVHLAKPRTAGRQLHRVSLLHSDKTASDYFKRSIWLPYVNAVVVHMQDKFNQTSQTALLLPSVLTRQKVQMESFKKVFGMYGK